MTTAPVLINEERWTMPPQIADADPYRYAFFWRWAPGPLRVYVGLNPSTATALKDDATVRRWKGFCDRDGFGGFIAVNCFSFRATDPDNLVGTGERGIDLIGPDGEALFQVMVQHPHVTEVVACWGNSPDKRLTPRLKAIAELIVNPELHPHPVKCFGLTQEGQPKHPLYLSREAPLVAFTG